MPVLTCVKVIFTQLIGRIDPPTPEATRTLILVHRRELVEQAARHCQDAYPNKSVEVEMGNIHASGYADITVASIWSIISGDRLSKFDPASYKLVLVDEAHHIVAASFMETLRHFGLVKSSAIATDPVTLDTPKVKQSPALVGVSATLSRFDGLRLSDAIDHIVYHKDYVDMIGEKWLSDVIFTTVQSKADLSAVKKSPTGDFQARDLSKAVNTPATNETTVRAWMSRAAERKSTLVFCVDLAHVSDLTAAFRRHGIDARFVTGDTHKVTRSERLDAFRNGDFAVLLNCGVFTEGTDIPNIDCIILARPTKSRNLLVQMIGRGMRLHPGKLNCHVLDMVASLEAGVVTIPTLFGLDPAAMVKEATVDGLKAEKERTLLEAERQKHVEENSSETAPMQSHSQTITFTDYDSVFDLIDDTSGDRHIRGISPLAWVMVGPSRFVLSNQNGDYITIEAFDDDTGYNVQYVRKLPETIAAPESKAKAKSPYMRPREVAKAETLSDAVHAADTFASKTFPWQFVQHNKAWRKAPATEGQLAFLNKMRPMKDQLTPEMISKGKATDMITKMKFGAKGWFSRLEADRKRDSRSVEKARTLDDLKQRERVKVGPLLWQDF